MADSSGFLGGDDSSRLEALAKSIQENSEKLGILNKLIGKVEDASSKKSEPRSTSDILADLEKFVSKKDIETARKKSLAAQADQDRLASNTFRASETIISEILSRVGGTSFYPALSAFRVARESVSTATGIPQSELKVGDMLKFVNDSTNELIMNLFKSIGVQIGLLNPKVDDLTKSIEQYKLSKQEEIDIQEALAPTLSKVKKELKTVMDVTQDELDQLKEEDVQKFASYITALEKIGAASKKEIDTLDKLKKSLEITDPEFLKSLRAGGVTKDLEDIFLKEQDKFKKESPELTRQLEREKELSIKEQNEITKQAKTIAGLAGLAVPIGILLTETKQIINDVKNLGSEIISSVLAPLTGASGNQVVGSIPRIAGAATQITKTGGQFTGAAIASPILGPVLGPLVGSFVGGVITETILAPINIAAQTLVSINNSVTQIADNLVGFSPQVTGAVVAREIAILKDDFRRAAMVGPQVARITEAQTRLELATRQAFDKFLVTTEPYLVNILDLLTNLVFASGESLKAIQSIIPLFAPWLPAALNLLGPMAANVDDIAKRLGTDDPLEIASIANQGGLRFWMNNPGANVTLP